MSSDLWKLSPGEMVNEIERLQEEVERWKGLAVHHESISDEARMSVLIERAKIDKAVAKVKRLRAALKPFVDDSTGHREVVGKITGNHFCFGCWKAWPCDQSIAIAALADQGGEDDD